MTCTDHTSQIVILLRSTCFTHCMMSFSCSATGCISFIFSNIKRMYEQYIISVIIIITDIYIYIYKKRDINNLIKEKFLILTIMNVWHGLSDLRFGKWVSLLLGLTTVTKKCLWSFWVLRVSTGCRITTTSKGTHNFHE